MNEDQNRTNDSALRLNDLQRYIFNYGGAINHWAKKAIARELDLPLSAVEEAASSLELRAAWDEQRAIEREKRNIFCNELETLCNKHGFVIEQTTIERIRQDQKVAYSTFEDHRLYLSARITSNE